MKAKIFAKLKQEYSSLGLGDEILMSRAESLSSTGLVTDENIDAVVACQRKDLEGLQKANDKRVNDALEKERKKHEEETRKKEEEAKAAKAAKEADEAAKKKAEEDAAKKKADEEEANKKAKEKADAEAKAEEERKKLLEEANLPANVLEILERERKAADERTKAIEEKFSKMFEGSQKAQSKREAELAELQKSYAALMESNTQLKQGYDAMKQENETALAAKKQAERDNFILSKAKELGVPQWRIDEGFVIASDADNETIEQTISKVANNIRTQQLPGSRATAPMSDGQPTQKELADMAKSIVK